ncbi:MAG: hypothetical protein KDB14_27420, partial [Planctomycetales bacterium]|nr:hypothetical protein [Planctomycetales bacterium]
MSELNPYRHWLGLPMAAPNHYELLGLSPGESNVTTIESAANHVRRQVCAVPPAAEHAAAWSSLLTEIELAESVLCHPARRADYEQQLGITPQAPMAQPVSSPPPPLPTMEARPFGAAPMGVAYPAYPANAAQPVSSATAVAPGGPDPMAPVGQLAATSPTSPPTAPTAAAPAVKAPKRKRTRSNNNLSMVLAMAAVGMLLVAVVVMINRGQGRNS